MLIMIFVAALATGVVWWLVDEVLVEQGPQLIDNRFPRRVKVFPTIDIPAVPLHTIRDDPTVVLGLLIRTGRTK